MRDVAVKPIMWTAVAIAITVTLVVVAVFALLRVDRAAPGGDRFRFGYRASLDAPGLASAPQPDLASEQRKKQQRLQSSGWVDEAGGVAHIPIGDAMDVLAARAKREKQP